MSERKAHKYVFERACQEIITAILTDRNLNTSSRHFSKKKKKRIKKKDEETFCIFTF